MQQLPVTGVEERAGDVRARFELFEEVADRLATAAGAAPLVIVLDDLHSADATSLLLVQHLAGVIRSLPVLLVATVRTDVQPGTPEWAREVWADLVRHGDVVAVGPLGEDEVTLLLREATGCSGRAPPLTSSSTSSATRLTTRLAATIPPENLDLHVVVVRPDGLDILDSCPDEATFTSFHTGQEFRSLREFSGLPEPRVTGLGDVVTAAIKGARRLSPGGPREPAPVSRATGSAHLAGSGPRAGGASSRCPHARGCDSATRRTPGGRTSPSPW